MDDREATWRDILRESNSETRVAESSHGIVGWISTGPARDSDVGPEFGEIWALYVDPKAWRGGAGRALWEAAREAFIAGGYTGATLWVLEENPRARRFYEAIGFRIDPGIQRIGRRGDLALSEVRMRCSQFVP